ncbi:hypothetical protein [Serratia oryzae]|uniref:Uncharacterized protein n=1 Tax=Serratia oryzae TaxID=2034155 RepID=A0A1S8CR71_9GAMM|nr:hypothetical protein [Serratia oryzae]OMQ27327.1 hypothetical protein BMI79_03105 [Serratia oryzae]
MAQLLREALFAAACQSLMYHAQIKLDQIASPNNPHWTDRERAFMVRQLRFRDLFQGRQNPGGSD